MVAWVAMSLTRLVRGLGAGVEVRVVAPEISCARVLDLVARVTESSTRLVLGLGVGVDVGAAAPETGVGGWVSSLVT